MDEFQKIIDEEKKKKSSQKSASDDFASFINREKTGGTSQINARDDFSNFLKSGATVSRDPKTREGLTTLANEAGLSEQAEEITGTPKLSFLQRLSAGLGAFNPAEAVAVGMEKGAGAGLLEYPKSIVRGLGSAFTGTDYQPERRSFGDVVETLGVENSVAKFGLGVLGDILLDPTTYFGGTIAKGLMAGTKGGANVGLKILGRASPEIEAGLRLAGKGAADAFGKAFVYGYGTSKGLADDLLEIQSKMDKARMGIVQSNLERLGTGTLSPSQQEELVTKLVAGKVAEFSTGRATEAGRAAGKAALEGGDQFVSDVARQQALRSQKFAGQANISDPFEVYFPFINKEKIKGFLEGTKKLQVGSEGYRKMFRNILTDEQIIKDPVEAFARNEWNIVKDNIVRSELGSLVKGYGKDVAAFASADDAARAGYTTVREKGVFGKVIGYMKEADKKFIDSMITPEFTTIDKIAKATGFDAITALFKRSVTGLFLPFHVRNYVSGMVQNFEVLGADALNPATIAAGNKLAWKIAQGEKFTDEIISAGGQQVNVGKAMNAFIKRFGGDSSYVKDITDLTSGTLKPEAVLGLTKKVKDGVTGEVSRQISKEGVKALAMETLKTGGLGRNAALFRAARATGQFIEHQQKGTAFIAALKRGDTIEQALKVAEKAGFDYRALTPFESKFMRRIIPFYSFTRKNVELQLKTLGENPQRINEIMAIINNAGESPSAEENKYLPSYIRNSLGIKLGDTPEGVAQYISNFGTPIEAFADLINGNPILKGISMMNPLIKAPVEIGIGKDSFRQRDLKDVYDAKEYSAAPQILKDFLQIEAVEKPVLKKNAAGKLQEVGTRIEYVADPVRLLIARSMFTSRGFTYFDEIFDGDLDIFLKTLKSTTGLKIQQVDTEMMKNITEKKERQALQDLLEQYGEISSYDSPYIPKNRNSRGVLSEDEVRAYTETLDEE